MSLEEHVPESIIVLTTEERSSLFVSVIGSGADMRFTPRDTTPLRDFLINCALSGGELAILDEEHFIDVDDLVHGVESYLDDPEAPAPLLRLVIVCSARVPGDPVLYWLATYCGLYDIVYGCEGGDVSAALAKVLHAPNTRRDVLDVLHEGPVPPHALGWEGEGCGQAGEVDAPVGGVPDARSHEEERVKRPIEINIKIEI